MKFDIKELKNLLHLTENDLKPLSLEKLRLLLGVFRYVVRTVEREVNERESFSKM